MQMEILIKKKLKMKVIPRKKRTKKQLKVGILGDRNLLTLKRVSTLKSMAIDPPSFTLDCHFLHSAIITNSDT